MLFLSVFMVIVSVATIGVGIYSPFFANGGAFVFFLSLYNVYMWILVYLNWPTDLSEAVRTDDYITSRRHVPNPVNDNSEFEVSNNLGPSGYGSSVYGHGDSIQNKDVRIDF